jgi:16S rRNA (uracil1498-N3)-methyltransferase
MIPTFLYKADDMAGDTIIISGTEAHHIARVMRLDRSDMIRMSDGQGTTHLCEISAITPKKINCRIIKTLKNSGEPGIHLTLAAGLSASFKFDTIVQKATEVGVSRFVPLLCNKGMVKTGDKAALKRKINRWRRICEAAVKQSGRSRIPAIERPIDFIEFLDNCDPKETFLFHPGDRSEDISILTNLKTKQEITIIVGPESGFSPSELEAARDHGISIITLGDRILRTETAGIVLPALVIYLSDIVKS